MWPIYFLLGMIVVGVLLVHEQGWTLLIAILTLIKEAIVAILIFLLIYGSFCLTHFAVQ